MSDGKGIINIDLSGLSDAASKLIEKVSDGIGGAFAPRQVIRMANAHAEADLIAAYSQIEISELQRRALSRLAAEEARKQKNIEQITGEAIPLLEGTSHPDKIDEDWIASFFEKSRIVSDQEMQSLWARLLASEANLPGSMSRRAINLLADLDKEDAEKFSALCNFGWSFGRLVPLIFGYKDEAAVRNGLTYEALVHLESLGLIRLASVGDFQLDYSKKTTLAVVYFDRALMLQIEAKPLNVGKVLLTPTGAQLARIARTTALDCVYDYVADHFESKGFAVTRVPSQRSSK